MAKKGIDISTFQSKVDYAKVKADGVEYAILRVGYTGYGTGKKQAKDNLFEIHYKGCKDAGIAVGCYFFGRGTSSEEGKQEANYVLELIKGKTFEYPVFYDTEDTYYQAKATKEQNTAACKAFCDTIKDAGYNTGIYASKSWFTEKLNDAELKDYDHWVAQYYNSCTYKGDYTMWQYTSSGKVDGISGNVDMNWCYKEYVKDSVPVQTKPSEVSSIKNTFGAKGVQVTLKGANLYVSSGATNPSGSQKTGTYYIWSNEVINNRVRITTRKDWAGVVNKVTGWVDITQINTSTNITVTKPVSSEKKYTAGTPITLKNGKLYLASTGKAALTKTKTYYIYDGNKINGRYRVTNDKKNCNKKPIALYVSGWVEV